MVLELDVKDYATRVLQKRFDRLSNRKLVLFPWLRAKWLLRKIAFLKNI